MTLLLVSLALILASATAVALPLLAEQRAIAALRTRIRTSLAREGLTLTGDPLGSYELVGKTGETEVSLRNGVPVKRGGRRETTRLGAIVKVSAPLPDLVVCRTEEADATMGMLPSVPRLRTGDDRFDGKYSVFASDVPSYIGMDFRSAPRCTALAWATPQVLNPMVSLGMTSFRTREGHCEVVIEPVRPWTVGVAFALGANIARSAASQPLVASTTPCGTMKTEPASGVAALWPIGSAAALGTMFGWVPMSFLPLLREFTESEICGNGGRILVSSSSHGSKTSYGLYCSNSAHTSLFVHYAACDALLVAVVSIVCAVVAGRRGVARRHWADTSC